ncbi:MAG: single-stranded DNA-binding protein [Candidatus Aegiribacteria sp.]|nr:single-stranded DNA-binding protein [Candidatus Aegiribacteria sp.]
MTVPHEMPELNYILFTGTVERIEQLSLTRFNIFVIRFEVENTVTFSTGTADSRKTSSILSVEAWGNLAEEIDRRIKSGSTVLVEGSLVSRSYEDRSKGLHHRMVVKATSVESLGARS